MNNYALQRVQLPVDRLSELLTRGRNQKEKGKGFYVNKGRDILFQLEGLCRAYKQIQDKKLFEKWQKEFKRLEDFLGSMDNNESMWKEFSAYKELKKSASNIFLKRFEDEALLLGDLLRDDGWSNGNKLKLFREELLHVEWKEEEQDVAAFGKVICDEFDKLISKYRDGELDMTKLEEGIHEFRRKLRWISIYAQASNGMVRIRPVKSIPPDFIKYCTPDVVKSPFNILPKAGKNQQAIELQSHYFFALSWLIRQLSEWKDAGLKDIAFRKLLSDAGVRDATLKKKFLDSLVCHPDEIATLSESAVDEFIYRDFVPERICRDIMRSLQ